MIDRNKMPKPTDKINVKEFIDSITPEDNTAITGDKEGDYFGVSYKQMMQEILKGKTEVTHEELANLIHSGLARIIKRHTYFSKQH
jgi:hypothetical protein